MIAGYSHFYHYILKQEEAHQACQQSRSAVCASFTLLLPSRGGYILMYLIPIGADFIGAAPANQNLRAPAVIEMRKKVVFSKCCRYTVDKT